jgi:2-polyprenyl-3-methyl-5-hydroxy-6-metoxy-1,4-benzoquinol methylase
MQCEFLFVSPPPTQTALTAFYQREDYHQGDPIGYTDYFGQRAIHERDARRRLGQIEKLCFTKGKVLESKGSILDVGCAAGFFLSVAQQRKWQPYGVELSGRMAKYATQLIGQPIVPCVANLVASPASFTAITLWEYIEHIPDPRIQLKQLVPLLKPGGVLAISTPNTDYWDARYQPQRWREFKPPAHIGFFTTKTLQFLLTSCGLEVIKVNRNIPGAPRHPYPFQRFLHLLKAKVGYGLDRRTPFWWSFGLSWRVVEQLSRAWYQLRWRGCDLCKRLEIYARKPCP